jgi:2-amino-4-hydroxy-6-hydroxymethyldihydropteridine diphosphokinase/dihydropteroate synthase
MANLKKSYFILQTQIGMRSNVVLGIGSNLGDRVNWIHAAFNALIASGKFKLVNTSRLYQTIPRFQPKEELDLPYLNAAAALKTNLSADQVLVVIKKIEENLGRDLNKQRYSSREIDLDILCRK